MLRPVISYKFIGGGTLFVLEITPSGDLIEISKFQWTDGLFDVSWSECNPGIVATASGDGSLQLWNLTNRQVKTKHYCISYILNFSFLYTASGSV